MHGMNDKKLDVQGFQIIMLRTC